ncbi:MAG: hypothetical protein HY901_02845 [Deltaproteobacteria bacterium]|nr:hypothetical protein [Deltaproteobacteria bacterium]
MDSQQTTPKNQGGPPGKGRQGACQVCGKVGGVVFDPEKAPPNRLCFRCASEYGMQDSDDE